MYQSKLKRMSTQSEVGVGAIIRWMEGTPVPNAPLSLSKRRGKKRKKPEKHNRTGQGDD